MCQNVILTASLFACTAAFASPVSARESTRPAALGHSNPGYLALTSAPRADLFLVKAGPTNDDIARGVLKVLGALVLHDQSQPQPNDDAGDAFARALARVARDKLIDSALEDLFPNNTAVERAAVRNLVLLALDGRLTRDRDRVVAYLRRTNPDMADAVEAAEFLIQLAQAVEKSRK